MPALDHCVQVFDEEMRAEEPRVNFGENFDAVEIEQVGGHEAGEIIEAVIENEEIVENAVFDIENDVQM